jgi:hypothetical protein
MKNNFDLKDGYKDEKRTVNNLIRLLIFRQTLTV